MKTSTPDTLDAVAEDIWQRLEQASKDRHSAMHTPVVCSADGPFPTPRIMVLRGVDRNEPSLRFHTDLRSAKARHIAENARVSVLAYDPQARVQIVANGMGQLEAEGPRAQAAWASSALTSRRCYLAEGAPGVPLEAMASGLPPHLLDRAPTHAESEAGWPNFAIVIVRIERIEWLKLTACGNCRASFRAGPDGWTGSWIQP